MQVQILVLRLSHRDPGVTVERHPAAPLAGMGKSIPSCQGEINRVFQPPPELRQGEIPSRGRAHNTRSSRHSTKSAGMWTSRPRFTLFPITSNLVYSEWERLRQPHGHRRSHRPGDPPHHYPRVRRPQLPHRCGPAAGSGTEGESQSPVNRHPPTPYSSGCPRSIQERPGPKVSRLQGFFAAHPEGSACPGPGQLSVV